MLVAERRASGGNPGHITGETMAASSKSLGDVSYPYALQGHRHIRLLELSTDNSLGNISEMYRTCGCRAGRKGFEARLSRSAAVLFVVMNYVLSELCLLFES